MNNTWPFETFIEDIQNEGCALLDIMKYDNSPYSTYNFLSLNGKTRVIILADDEITTTTIQEYLNQLELNDLIDRKYHE